MLTFISSTAVLIPLLVGNLSSAKVEPPSCSQGRSQPDAGISSTADVKRPTVLIKSGRLLDTEAGIYRDGVRILIRDGKIVSMGTDVAAPPDAQVYDLSNLTVLPGLIDAETHLLFMDKSFGSDPRRELARNIRLETPLRVEQAEPRATDFLRAGFTTVRDLGNSGLYGDLYLQRGVTAGLFPGPRMIVSGPSLSPENGHLQEGTAADFVAQEYRVLAGADDARSAVVEHIKKGVSLIKVEADNFPNGQILGTESLNAVVDEAHSRLVKVSAQAHFDKAVRNAVLAGVDSIEGAGQVSDDTLELMAERRSSDNKVFLIPTDVDRKVLMAIEEHQRPGHSGNQQRVDEVIASAGARLRRAIALGVPLAMGSNMTLDLSEIGLSPGQSNKHTIYAYVEEGASPLMAVQMATIYAGEAVGLKDKIGVLKVGAYADVLAVEGDPLANIHALDAVRFVMRDGAVFNPCVCGR